MTLAQNLPVYRITYDMLVLSFKIVKNFSREYKYTVGEEIKREMFRVVLEIVRANRAFEKRKNHIQSALEHLEAAQLAFRVLRDLGQIKISDFVVIAEQTEMAHRQLAGWMKKTQ